MTLTLTILGCGSSAGVPRPALGWGRCDPNNPKNRRRRCSLLVERASNPGITRVLIDTSPDLREQLIDANVDHIDAVGLVGMLVGQEHGVDMIDVGVDQLLAQVRRGIDQDARDAGI